MPAVQAALLNESATLFPRKYYTNGSHADFILYLSDSQVNEDDVKGLRQALKDSRGPAASGICSCTRRAARKMACS